MLSKIKKIIPVNIKIFILSVLPSLNKKIRSVFGWFGGISIIKPDQSLPNYYLTKGNFSSTETVIDVGCGFDADFSVYMIQKYDVKAIGVDPTSKHKTSLESLENKYKGKFLYKPLAISKTTGKITFNESVSSTSGSILKEHINIKNKETKTYEIESVTLKDLPKHFNLPQIDYIKLDIEGAEYELIQNVSNNDLQKYKQIFIEFHHHALPQYSQKDTLKLVNKIKSFTLDNHDFLFYR